MLQLPRWQIWTILIICFLTPFIIASNFFSKEDLQQKPYLVQKQINLGLDLQGGVHLSYQADMDSFLNSKLLLLKKDIRAALRPTKAGEKKIRYRSFQVKDHTLSFEIFETDSTLVKLAHTRLAGMLASLNTDMLGEKEYAIEFKQQNVFIKMSENALKKQSESILGQAIEVMRRRIDAFGTREPNILRQGLDTIIVQVSGESNVERLKAEIGKTAKMTFHLVNQDEPIVKTGSIPAGYVAVPDVAAAGVMHLIEKQVLLSGNNLVNAQFLRDEYGRPTVGFTFDATGSRIFGRVTTDNIGRAFAIVLDNKVISAPRIQGAILGGNGVISGNFTLEEASNLALLLRSGALPVDLKIAEERTIGAELGKESVQDGRNAMIYGFIAVSVFMIFYYGIVGSFSVVALLLNTAILFAVLTLLQATLTLPGIAGIVLGMGVAVDANVLINERIREELRQGASILKAVSMGYERAWMTILDSHVTGIVSALIMFLLGAGPIRGFAVTLALGILLSLFTSVWVSRMLFATYLNMKKPQTLRFGLSGV